VGGTENSKLKTQTFEFNPLASEIRRTYIHLKVTTETEHHELADAPFRLGEWLVEPRLNRLTRGGESIQIELKMMDVLVCLAERANELVTRRQITDTVWATEYITEKTLTRAVAELRRTLGDDAKQPRYIETIHRKGYRLIAPTEVVERPTATVTPFPRRSIEREDDRSPYPGLAAFTEDDAEFFFGREVEVAQLWRKITARRLLAVIGPSGIGKSSLLRAGLIPASPDEWGSLIFHPGESAFKELGRALVPEFGGDTRAIGELLYIDAPERAVALVSRWRALHQRALLVVDQFEELFTLNPPEVRARFAALIGSLTRDADVHVLLAIRDDFLYRCNDHEALLPVYSELTPVKVPARDDLHRAMMEPAARLGYSFEDEKLADEMMDAVADERGALPMLAFAVARLWEQRDRERKLLTWQAYSEIGGVAGALAHHAEGTLERIGRNRLAVVRELFRNLVTAEGTRAVREWDEVLSVFSGDDTGEAESIPAREAAEDVLRELIDARLLTSYEISDDDETPTRRVEIVHESLLTNWPRLVGWQTQDADSARLRDELRQAARTWREHDQTDDLLWTGSAYREYALWRERYPGGLSELEEEYSRAMTAHAKRRSRRRRTAVAAAFAVLLAVLGVVGVSRQQAIAEANRAEAAKLVALAQVRLQTDPTEALAFTTASLEVTDTPAARSFMMRALWEAPPAIVLDSRGAPASVPRFSPDGSAIALAGFRDVATVWWDTGDGPLVLDPPGSRTVKFWTAQWISRELLATGVKPQGANAERVFIWSIPEGRLLRTIEFGGPTTYWQVEGHRLLTETFLSHPTRRFDILLRSWQLPDGEGEEIGRRIDWKELMPFTSLFDPSGDAWIYATRGTIFTSPLPMVEGGRDRVVGVHDADRARVLSHHTLNGGRFMSRDDEGALRVWSLAAPGDGPLRVIPRPEGAPEDIGLLLDRTGRWVYPESTSEIGKGLLWDSSALPGARPLHLRRSGSWQFANLAVHPKSEWAVATAGGGSVGATFWSLRKTYPSVVEGASSMRQGLAFSSDGRWLATIWPQNTIRLFPLSEADQAVTPTLAAHYILSNPVFDPAGEHVTGGRHGRLVVVPMDGGEPRSLEGFATETLIEAAAFSPSGRLVAAASGIGVDEYTLRVWDLKTGEAMVYDLPRSGTSIYSPGESGEKAAAVYEDNVQNLWFTDEDTLFTIGATRFLKWDLKHGSSEEVVALPPVGYRTAAASAGVRKVLMVESLGGDERDICATPELLDLEAGTTEALPSFGDCVRVVALDPTGTVAVTGDADGVVRVGRVAGGEPHLLAGHDGAIESVAVSPDLRWIASVGSDTTLRLWPMPDLEKPPLHTLPHDQLIAKLHSLTNLRAVRNDESSTGWKIEIGAFPGWETVPTW
jgi:DNA-binding winged helix-turn-helix (wHTH) protein/WD40 repeat protein